MTISASEVTDRLKTTLHDIGAVRWTIDDQYLAIDDAQKAILEARPDLFEVVEDVQLQGLGAKQNVPPDCYALFDITYNLDSDKKPFSGVIKTDRATMDRALSNWMVCPSCPHIEHWMQDIRERKVFWVYPPAAEDPETGEPGWIEMRYARRPQKITSPDDLLSVPDEMMNSVYYFAMTRLLERDEKFAGSRQSEMFLQKFALTIGARTKGEAEQDQIREVNEA